MPKLKTHRGAAKRFSLTSKGKIKRSKAYASHILTKKRQKEREIYENPRSSTQQIIRRLRD